MTQPPSAGAQERHQRGRVPCRPGPSEGRRPQHLGPELLAHPAGVHRSRVHHVGRHPQVCQLAGRCDDQPVESALGRAVRQVAHHVVAGQGDHPAAPRLRPAAFGVLLEQQPARAHVDRVVPVEALHRRVEKARVDALGVAHHQRGHRAQRGLHLVEHGRGRGDVGEVRRYGGRAGAGRTQVLRHRPRSVVLAWPRHPVVVLAPVGRRDVPAVLGEPPGDRRADADRSADAGDERDGPAWSGCCSARGHGHILAAAGTRVSNG